MTSVSFEAIVNVLTWNGNCVHPLASIILLFSILFSDNCDGISAQSQVMYAIINTIKCSTAFFMDFTTNDYLVCELLYTIIVNYCTLLLLFLSKRSYQKEYDKIRIGTLISAFAIAAATIILNYPISVVWILFKFAVYLETIAIIPQFQFVIEAKKIRPVVFFYISAVGLYPTINTVYLVYHYHDDWDHNAKLNYNLVKSLIFYGFYFMTIIRLRLCCCQNKYQQVEITTVKDRVENDILDTNLDSIVNTVVLTLDSLSGAQSKMDLSKTEEKI